ncbi:hypothetical protein GCM10023063_25630 [Arthrobacter methylotrophus]|uniref:Uncharacterized protein n=1 Tax=Arthrobacter methylotrophus TaxID=121291 RepID=A0ABV5UJH0_9MICC
MPSLNETSARVRAAHLLVRSAEEWDTLSEELLRAYDLKDNDKVEMLHESVLAAWKSVTRNLLTDPLNAIGIAVTPATTYWGIATLTAGKRNRQPQLTQTDTPGTSGTQPRLRNFEEVMADYNACLEYLAGNEQLTTAVNTPSRKLQ